MRKWSRILPLISIGLVLVALLAALGSKFGFWPGSLGVQAYVLTTIGALICAIAGAISLVLSALNPEWKHLVSRFGIVVVIAAAFLGYTFMWMPRLDQPTLHDISTDLTNPPAFDAALRLRGNKSNSVTFSEKKAAVQRQLYPELKSLVLPEDMGVVFERSLTIARSMDWEIIASHPDLGRIEAVATSFWFRFKDDIVIRILPSKDSGGSVVDLRSTSRIGISDLGANAKRVKQFMAELEAWKD